MFCLVVAILKFYTLPLARSVSARYGNKNNGITETARSLLGALISDKGSFSSPELQCLLVTWSVKTSKTSSPRDENGQGMKLK